MRRGKRTVTNGSARHTIVSNLVASGVIAIGIFSMMFSNACLGETGVEILSSDGKRLYMRSQSFTLDGHRRDVSVTGSTDQGGEQAHLVRPSGFLDDAWHHRSYWVFGRGYGTSHNGWFRAGRFAPAGRMLVFDENTVYGYGRQPQLYVWSTALEYQFFAAERQVKQAAIDRTLAANRKQESPGECADWCSPSS